MTSIMNQNIFFWDASANTFTEYTKELNKYDNNTQSITFNSGDRLYIASVLPFNNRYFKIGIPNTNASANLIIEYYSGAGWKNPSRVLDYTKSIQTFDKSGQIVFVPDDKNTISQQSDTDTIQDDNFKNYAPRVYNMFWQGIGFDADVTIGFNFIGHLYSTSDSEIYAQYPMLDQARYLTQWNDDKVDWEAQRIMSTNVIIKELEKRSIIMSPDQVLDTARLNEACIHHTAMTIFSGLGVDRFEKEIERAGKRYNDAMYMDKYSVDLNADALLSQSERRVSIAMRSR